MPHSQMILYGFTHSHTHMVLLLSTCGSVYELKRRSQLKQECTSLRFAHVTLLKCVGMYISMRGVIKAKFSVFFFYCFFFCGFDNSEVLAPVLKRAAPVPVAVFLQNTLITFTMTCNLFPLVFVTQTTGWVEVGGGWGWRLTGKTGSHIVQQ